MDDVGRDAVAGELGRCTEGEVHLGRFGGAIGDLLGEAVPLARRQTDDRPHCCAAPVPSGELGDQQRGRPSVDREHLVDRARRHGDSARGRSGPMPAGRTCRRSTRCVVRPGSAPGRAAVRPRRRARDRSWRRKDRPPPPRPGPPAAGSIRPRSRPGPCGWPDRLPGGKDLPGHPAGRCGSRRTDRGARAARRLGRCRTDAVVRPGDERNPALHRARPARPPGPIVTLRRADGSAQRGHAVEHGLRFGHEPMHQLGRRDELGDRADA